MKIPKKFRQIWEKQYEEKKACFQQK